MVSFTLCCVLWRTQPQIKHSPCNLRIFQLGGGKKIAIYLSNHGNADPVPPVRNTLSVMASSEILFALLRLLQARSPKMPLLEKY